MGQLRPDRARNLIPLCSAHHHLVHEGRWTLTLQPDRTITLHRPDGTLFFEGPTIDRSAPPPSTVTPAPPLNDVEQTRAAIAEALTLIAERGADAPKPHLSRPPPPRPRSEPASRRRRRAARESLSGFLLEKGTAVVYRVLADLVVIFHLAFVAFVAVGALLAWQWPRLVRVDLAAVAWAAAIVAIGFTCPLTPLEKALRRRASGDAYHGGFIDHYLTGVIYPGHYLGLARALVARADPPRLRRPRVQSSLRAPVADEVEAGHDRRFERPVLPLRHVGVGDLDGPQTDHVEWEAVIARRLVERGHSDVLEEHLQVDLSERHPP